METTFFSGWFVENSHTSKNTHQIDFFYKFIKCKNKYYSYF